MDIMLSGVDGLWALVPARYGDSFEWVLGVSPISSLEFVLGSIVAYLVVMYGLRYAIPFSPMKLPRLQALHNAFLCVVSLAMFLGTVLEVVRQLRMGKSLVYDLVCDPPGQFARGRLFVWSWLFHLSKFYELFDTLFLSLGKSQIRFLHTYHHVLTLLATYYGLYSQNTLQWVHVWMYYYYAVRTLGYQPWWKEYLTQLQIVQFLINLSGLAVWGYWTFMNPKEACHGDWLSWGITVVANVTFLHLFIQMYRETYRKDRPASNKPKTH